MCILLGAMFEISFDVAMNTAKDIIVEKYNGTSNITLLAHSSQMKTVFVPYRG